jgi:glycosyltransferase involved in cell wall biosynthesis
MSAEQSLLIEGWRGINHSYALVNQHHILELRRLPDLALYHQDLPFYFNHWQKTPGGGGFEGAEEAAIEALGPPPAGARIDCLYRVGSPFRAQPIDAQWAGARTLTFMAIEIGVGTSAFAPGAARSDFFTRGDNAIVTISAWARDRLIDYGYAPEKISTIPLGVDSALFRPMPAAERAALRDAMGFAPDEIVFVNVGVALWNKGIDILLRAFAAVRAAGVPARLVLKDQRDVYGISIEQMLQTVAADCPALLAADTLAAISVIGGRLERAQLRGLYCLADAYVSPYRAEGFNLPVLEAIACGTRVIVTAGGATDDFCNDQVAIRIPGSLTRHPSQTDNGRYIEPDLEALIAALRGCTPAPAADPAGAAARRAVLRRFNWAASAAEIARLALGRMPAPRPLVHSFDIFDTLIARRCLEPWRIFDQVAARTATPDFPARRIAAEAALAGQDYDFDDIYRNVARDLGAAQAAALRAAELAAEQDNVIPIAQNIAALAHGDLLVSDMYLRAPEIRSLLAAAGVAPRLGLIVSTQGKRSGAIWPLIAAKADIAAHLGDNLVSDIEMPARAGIVAHHTQVSALSPVELWLTQQGLPKLALFLREVRLRGWHAEPLMRAMQLIQLQINLPILLLSSVQLLRVTAVLQPEKLLFCSRDCDLWLALFQRLAPAVDAAYFYTSRIARRHPSADYLAYARAELGRSALMVDACGTGWSTAHLYQKLDITRRDIFLIHHVPPLDIYEAHDKTPDTLTVHTVIQPAQPLPNIGIELVNTAEHGSVVDVRMIGGAVLPVLGPGWDDPRMVAAIAVQRQAMAAALMHLAQLDRAELEALSAARIAELTQSLYEHLHAQPELREVFLPAYCREAVGVHAALHIPPP